MGRMAAERRALRRFHKNRKAVLFNRHLAWKADGARKTEQKKKEQKS